MPTPLLTLSRLVCTGFVCLAFLAAGSIHGAQTTYRYQAFVGASPPPTVSDFVAEETVLPSVETVLRGQAGGPFSDFQFARFTGGQVYTCRPFPQSDALSDDFTIVAYLRLAEPVDSGQDQVICSTIDPDKRTGIDLRVEGGGKLAGYAWFGDGEDPGTSSLHAVSSESELTAGAWYRLAFRYVHDAGVHLLDLWVDDEQVAIETVPMDLSRRSNELPPVMGAERVASEGFDRFLNADVFGIQVDDYGWDDLVLGASVIRDGSAYFGTPAFHDYLGLTDSNGKMGGMPLERRIAYTWRNADTGALRYPKLDERLKGLFSLPFMNDSYIPQGIATDPENRRLFVSMYRRTADSVPHQHPSIVVEILLPEGRLGNVFLLRDERGAPMMSHVGGIGYWNDLLFVPDSGGGSHDPDLFVYDISEQPKSTFDPATFDGFDPIELEAAKRLSDPLGAFGPDGDFDSLAFMGVHLDADNQLYLHLGGFDASQMADVKVFRLGFADGSERDPILSAGETLIGSNIKAQGLAFYYDLLSEDAQVRRSLLSTSYGNADSVIFVSAYSGSGAPMGKLEWLRGPAGMEEISLAGNSLWATSESGSYYYQKRPSNPWSDTFPFLMEVEIAELTDPDRNGIANEWEVRHGGSLRAAEDLDEDGFSDYLEYLADTDPRASEDFPGIRTSFGPLEIEFQASRSRFYTLQFSANLEQWTSVPGFVHRRGEDALMTYSPKAEELNGFFRLIVEAE